MNTEMKHRQELKAELREINEKYEPKRKTNQP